MTVHADSPPQLQTRPCRKHPLMRWNVSFHFCGDAGCLLHVFCPSTTERLTLCVAYSCSRSPRQRTWRTLILPWHSDKTLNCIPPGRADAARISAAMRQFLLSFLVLAPHLRTHHPVCIEIRVLLRSISRETYMFVFNKDPSLRRSYFC